jgi:hypothetical protein
MTGEELAELRKVDWMQSRVPVLDALCTFHRGVGSDGTDLDPALTKELNGWHEQRWYSVEGGSRVLVPNDGRPYDPQKFTVGVGEWDHNTCDYCTARIPAMTLCWVTRRDPYVILCIACYAREIRRKRWWQFW